jgi:hypothetical protein
MVALLDRIRWAETHAQHFMFIYLVWTCLSLTAKFLNGL